MKYGITLLEDRISPRSIIADSILFYSLRDNEASNKNRILVKMRSIEDLCEILQQNNADTLICGGITEIGKDFFKIRGISIINNVIGSLEEILGAIKSGNLQSGFGVKNFESFSAKSSGGQSGEPLSSSTTDSSKDDDLISNDSLDCLSCNAKICLSGKPCLNHIVNNYQFRKPNEEMLHMLDAAGDIACENERTLCRLSELIYFCLEMQYHRLGVAYCIDLEKPAEILVRVLRRFFKVYPVCCKIGSRLDANITGNSCDDKEKGVCCNPYGQAQALNRIETDINIMVGLCMGADCVFGQLSEAPSTALFIKDRSLANNPIGAVYSDYYLKEATQVGS